jgi:hypothetical protein
MYLHCGDCGVTVVAVQRLYDGGMFLDNYVHMSWHAVRDMANAVPQHFDTLHGVPNSAQPCRMGYLAMETFIVDVKRPAITISCMMLLQRSRWCDLWSNTAMLLPQVRPRVQYVQIDFHEHL